MKYHIAFDLDLRRNPYRGLYIALEGVDGSGKTTQAEALTRYFEGIGKTVVQTREPRKAGLIGDLVQKILTGEQKIPPVALQYLFSTDRVINHEEVIIPSLKAGHVVISDRSFWSAVVYGILDRSKGAYDKRLTNMLLITQSILSMYHQFTVPDFTFYLHISLQTALSRIAGKDDVKEIYEDKGKLAKIIEGYNFLQERFSGEITPVSGERSVAEVTNLLIDIVEKREKSA